MKYLLLFLFAFPVFADQVNLSFITPTTFTGDDLMPPGEVAGYHVYVDGVLDPSSPFVGTVNVAQPERSDIVIELARGATYSIELQTVTINQILSDMSIPIDISVYGKPNAPSDIGVTVIVTVQINHNISR